MSGATSIGDLKRQDNEDSFGGITTKLKLINVDENLLYAHRNFLS